jgi:superfamily I DNA and/or RNA helicase
VLELGLQNQNDFKQHGILIRNERGKSLIEPSKHIYFVDCGESYENFGDSTSATNKLEADVIVKLAQRIDSEMGRLSGRSKADRDAGIDKRMSMGVICTYGDQARNIKKRLRNNH